MKYLLRLPAGVLALFLVSMVVVSGAWASGCYPVQAESFIADGVKAVESGQVKGVVLRGDDLAAFVQRVGMTDANIVPLAVFGVAASELVMIVVLRTGDGMEVACVGPPNTEAESALRAHMARSA